MKGTNDTTRSARKFVNSLMQWSKTHVYGPKTLHWLPSFFPPFFPLLFTLHLSLPSFSSFPFFPSFFSFLSPSFPFFHFLASLVKSLDQPVKFRQGALRPLPPACYATGLVYGSSYIRCSSVFFFSCPRHAGSDVFQPKLNTFLGIGAFQVVRFALLLQ